MKQVELKCRETTRHIADKILFLRRANKLTQEEFAEKIGVDRRTIARAEDGKHRPSAETLEMIAIAFELPIAYFFDNSVYKKDISKTALIYEITTKLNVMPKSTLRNVLNLINIIENK